MPEISEVEARFIVGTGRCGSTILSKMLDLHPDVAVLSEFTVFLDAVKKYGERSIGGAELASILDCGLGSTGVFKNIEAHLATPEIVFDAQTIPAKIIREKYRDGVLPGLILIPLAQLFDEPMPVFDELVEFAAIQPVRLLSQQYSLLFDWLTRRAGKTLWIERSGGSFAQLPQLVELFPKAKFLHLHRSPLDTALSMQAHHHFRLLTFKYHGLVTATGISWNDLDDNDLSNDIPMSARLQSIFDHAVPLDLFLRDWNDIIVRGFTAIKELSPDQYAEISFENLMAEPAPVLQRIVDFFDLPPADMWLKEATALLNPQRLPRAQPSADQLAMLERYCHSGQVLLGQKPPVDVYS